MADKQGIEVNGKVIAFIAVALILAAVVGSAAKPHAQPAVARGTALTEPVVEATPMRTAINGTGKRVSNPITLKEGLLIASMSHTGGNRNFTIWLMDSTGRNIDLMANQIGPWSGEKAIRIERSGTYIFDVSADGAWEILLRQ